MDVACSGVDTKTGSVVPVKKPVHFDDAVHKLGLEHALGSLRLLKSPSSSSHSSENVNTANLPTQHQTAQETTSQQGAEEGQWVPLQLQLGLPLAPAELCDLVCR